MTLTKCSHESYAYYDPWGNRHLVFSQREYLSRLRWVKLTFLLASR